MENKKFESFCSNNILIKLAETEEEFEQIYRLRYFELILDYNKNQINENEMDKDEYDDICDQMIAVDTTTNKVIGTYRLLKLSKLPIGMKLLTEGEFDITPLKKYEVLEVGRAVVEPKYRDGATISMLWKGVIRYAVSVNVDFMIGTASFHGVDPNIYQDSLSYLHFEHLSPSDIRCNVNKTTWTRTDLKDDYDVVEAKKHLPPLIKGYLRLGATIGEGAYLDIPFNSLDVLIVLKISDIDPKYLKRFL